MSVTLFYSEQFGPQERNLAKLVEFLGGEIHAVNVKGSGTELSGSRNALELSTRCVFVSASALLRLRRDDSSGKSTRRSVAELGRNVIVYGYGSGEDDAQTLRDLSQGALVGVSRRPVETGDQCRRGLHLQAVGRFGVRGSGNQ